MGVGRYLIPVSWTLWGALVLILLWTFVRGLFERSDSPEISRGCGVIVFGLLLVVHAGVGAWLFWVTRRGSSAGAVVLTLLLAYPVFMLIAIPVVRAWKTWRFERALARVGDFPDPPSRALAESVRSGDTATLQRLLAGGPPPAGRDRAGNDLLAFAVEVVRDREGDPETVRILLEAGADPRESGTPDGGSLLHFMVLGRAPSATEVVRLLLEHGADPDAEDPHTGTTPMAEAGACPEVVQLLAEAGADIDRLLPDGESMLVRFIAHQHWDSALILIERGARLDVTSPDGLSVDHYLKEFEGSVYGSHPEGWVRVRTAIQARRR